MGEIKSTLELAMERTKKFAISEKEKIKEKVRVQLTEALKKDDIYGSAVEPKAEGSELWKKETEKLDHSYKTKLEEIKEQLRGHPSSAAP